MEVARQARARLVAAGLWLVAGGVAAWMLQAQDARIALGHEGWAGPALLLALHLLSFACWELVFLWRRLRLLRPLPPLVALGSWAWAGLPPAPPEPPPSSPGPDIVLLSLDTFRGDHVREDLTPELLDLGGAVYTNAVTTAPLTAPAHASMLTGLDVHDHGLLANGRVVEAPSFVERLAEAGYRTGAFVSAHVVDRHTGLDAGFHHFDDRWGWGQRMNWWPVVDLLSLPRDAHVRRGDGTVERALEWLSPGADFLWVHLYDAHGPYLVPPDWRPSAEAEQRARELDQATLKARQGTLTSLVELLQSGQPETEKLRYRSAIRYTDHLAGALFDGLDEDAVVIVVGDHGESLDEHGYWFNHGANLLEPSLHVPFLVRGLEVDGGDELIGVTAVHDLVLSAAGLGPPPARATEVLAYTTGQQAHAEAPGPDKPKGPKRTAALRFPGEKLVVKESASWYDLRLDPEELDPRSVPDALRDRVGELEALVEVRPPPLSEEQRLRLEALGYLE